MVNPEAGQAIALRPAERGLTRLLGRVRERHGLGPMADGAGIYPDLRQLKATLQPLEARAEVTIPADSRLVERALHPGVLDGVAAELGAAWANHATGRAGIGYADADTAAPQSLDPSTPFRELVFPDDGEKVATRLGARDLLVDFAPSLPGPFGSAVDRIAIPHWMAGGIRVDDLPQALGSDEAGERFQLGERTYVYGRWGLAPAP